MSSGDGERGTEAYEPGWVTRCICRDVPLKQIAELAKSGLGFDEIQRRTGCCTGCTMCEPYVREAMRTGAGRIALMSPQRCAAILASVTRS